MGYFAVLKREIDFFKKTPLMWVVSFILPFIMCLLVCLIFSKSSPVGLPVALLNEDNSEISRLIVRDINSMQSCAIKYNVLNLNEGKKLIENGNAYGLIVIPKNFQRDIYRLKQPKLVFYYNNQRILIGGIISKDVTSAVQSIIVGLDAKIKNKKGMPYNEAIKQSNLISVVEHVNSNPYFNYQYFLSLIAFGHILQIHFVFAGVFALGVEFKYGRAKDWLDCANGSILKAFLGKMTPYFIICSSLLLILYAIYFIFLKAPFVGNIFVAFFASFLFVAACLSISAIFIAINGSFRYALSNAAFYVAMGFAFAGVTYPLMSMPLAAKIYSAIIPLSYWIQVMLDQTIRKIPPYCDIKPLFYIVLLMLLGFLSLFRVKKLALDENAWFKQ